MKKEFALTFVIAMLSAMGIAAAQMPPAPTSIYGSLTLNGEPVPVGSRIIGYVGGDDVTYESPYYTESSGKYGSLTLSATKFFVQCYYGEQVHIRVEVPGNSGIYYDATQVALCDPGGEQNVDISLSGNPWGMPSPEAPPMPNMLEALGASLSRLIDNIRAWMCGNFQWWC